MTERVETRLGGQFGRLWAASTLSALGSGLATVAAPLFVAAHTDDPLVISAAAGVAWLPWLLFALPGGVLVDRVDRRRLMIVIDLVRVAVLAALTVAIMTGRAGVMLLLAALFVVNAGEVVLRAASQAMLPAVIHRDRLERANGWLGSGHTLVHGMLAGPLGGFLFVLAAAAPFLINAVAYALSAVFIALVAGTFRATATGVAGPPRRRSVRAEIVEGFRWLAGQRLLRTMTVLIGLLNVTLTAAMAMLVLLARERLGLDSVGYGLLFTCLAGGGLLGSVLGDRMIAAVTATWTVRIGLVVEAGLHLVLATSTSAVGVGVGLFVFGVHGALWNIVFSSLRQRLTPAPLLGRVGSTTLFLAAGGNCLGALLGGVVATTWGITSPYWIGFVVAVAVAAATWRVFDRATVARAYTDPTPTPVVEPAGT